MDILLVQLLLPTGVITDMNFNNLQHIYGNESKVGDCFARPFHISFYHYCYNHIPILHYVYIRAP